MILADILRQRVIDRLRTAEGETYSPNGGAEFSRVFPGWGRIALSVSCKPEAVPRIYAAIDAIAADLASTPVSDDELQRAIRPEVEGAARSQQQNAYWLEQLAGRADQPGSARVHPPDAAAALRRHRRRRAAGGQALAAGRPGVPDRGDAGAGARRGERGVPVIQVR